jgi:signal transduction histidine kinase
MCALFSFLLSNNLHTQPLDRSRSVEIVSIFINDKHIDLSSNKIVASENDSITINFKLKANEGAEKSPFLFKTLFKNSIDSSVKTLGVNTAIFKNLKSDNYYLKISAFDLQRKWLAISTDLYIEIDNEKSELYRSQDSLKSRINTLLDIVRTNSEKVPVNSNNDFFKSDLLILILLAILLILFIIILLMWYNTKKLKTIGNKNLNSDKFRIDSAEQLKNMIKKEDYDILLLENSRLRAEIASLRGQIDAMSIRGNQLSVQNKELQSNMTKLTLHKNELEELQKQKDELFAVIIHDIKNPAALIKSLVELLTSYDLSAIEQQEIISDIASTTTKIVALSQEVSRILSLETNKMNLVFEPCDINIVVKDVYHRNIIAAKSKSINMFTEFDETLPNAEIDPQRIDEVIDNLISNAVKFTPSGGTVRIKTYQDSSGVVVEINDNGLGLTEDDLKHAFQRGARLSAKPTQGESSTGLGLWIVKKLLDAHQGKVWVKSTIGKGSTFSFSIPLNQSEPK